MGNTNNTSINIKLDRSNPWFLAGETVSGTVFVNIINKQVKVKEIFIELQGEVGYTSTRTVSQQDGSSTTETVYNAIPFLHTKQILENVGKGQKEMVFCTAQFSWPFEFVLPHEIPPSINQPTDYPHVRYFLKFVMGRSWYKINLSKILYLFVYPRVNLSCNPQCLIGSTFEDQNRKDVRVKVHLTRHGYLCDESIMGRIEIENPQRIQLKQILLTLTQHYKIAWDVGEKKIFEIVLPTLVNRIDEQIIQNFSMKIPLDRLSPSYQYNNDLPNKVKVENNYYLKIRVKAEGMFTNFDIRMPITIGTESDRTFSKNDNVLSDYFALK